MVRGFAFGMKGLFGQRDRRPTRQPLPIYPRGDIGADVLAPPQEQRLLLSEALHAGMDDGLPDGTEDEAAPARELMEDEASAGPICLRPGCGKPTWNGEDGEYCSLDCQEQAPPVCKRPDCTNLSYVGPPADEYCSMTCKNKSTICLHPGCTKLSWNGRPKGFCSLSCFTSAEPVCMLLGCSKKTWNGRPAGYCTPECRDEAKHVTAKRLKKDPSKLGDLDSHIAHVVSGKLATMTKAEQESEKSKMESAKAHLMEAQTGRDLLLKAEVFIHENWLGEIQALPGNIYTIGAFGRLRDYRAETAYRTMGRVFGWMCIWVLQVLGPPAIWLSTVFAWGVQTDMAFHWTQWKVDLDDWHHIALTKWLALIFQVCFVLNGLYVIMDEREDWRRIHSIIRYMRHYNPKMSFDFRAFLYIGAITNCWVVLWCCADTVVVLGSSQSPKDVLFDSLTLLFLYNLDDIGGELGFVSESDWPGSRLGWIHEYMVSEKWHLEEAGSFKKRDKEEGEEEEKEFDERRLGKGGAIVQALFTFTIAVLMVAVIVLPVFNAITPFLSIAPPDGGWPSKGSAPPPMTSRRRRRGR